MPGPPLASYPILLLGRQSQGSGHHPRLCDQSPGLPPGPLTPQPPASPSTLWGHKAWSPPLWRPASSPQGRLPYLMTGGLGLQGREGTSAGWGGVGAVDLALPWGTPPPQLGCGIRGAGGLEAGLALLSHHKVLQGEAWESLCPQDPAPRPAPALSSTSFILSLGGDTLKMGTSCYTAKMWEPPKRPLTKTEREDP